MVRFCNFHICKVLGRSNDGDIIVFSYRSRSLVVVICIFPCIKLTWVYSIVIDTYTLKGHCPHESYGNSGRREDYSLWFWSYFKMI